MSDLAVTVTGAGSLYAQGILKSLRDGGEDMALSIQGLDYFPDAFGFRYCRTTGLLPDLLAPSVPEQEWYEALKEAVRAFGSRVLFVGADFELLPLSRRRDDFLRETGCRIVISSEEVVAICKDKLRTAKVLRDAGLAAPRSLPAEDGFESGAQALGLPFIVKPRFGARGRGVALVCTAAEFDSAVAHGESPMMQEYFPDADSEYTCGVLVIDGAIDAVTPLRRRLRDGNTWSARAAGLDDPDDRAVTDYCRRVAELLRPEGPVNVQCRIRDGQPAAFEINPRFSGTTYFRTLLGVNEPIRLLLAHIGAPLAPGATLRPGGVRRYFEECLEVAGE